MTTGDIVQCKCGCGHWFKQKDDQHAFYRRECARTWEHQQRGGVPDIDAEIDRVLLGFGEELKRVLRKR